MSLTCNLRDGSFDNGELQGEVVVTFSSLLNKQGTDLIYFLLTGWRGVFRNNQPTGAYSEMRLRMDILDEHRIDHCITYVCVFAYIKDCMSQIQFRAGWTEKNADSVGLGLKFLTHAVLHLAYVKSMH